MRLCVTFSFFILVSSTSFTFNQFSNFNPHNDTHGDNDNDNFYEIDVNAINNHPNWRLLNESRCGETLADRIIGGTAAYLGQYPWIARLGYSKLNRSHIQFSCGGSLITSCWVLSASHCVTALPSDLFLSGIRLGEYDIRTAVDCDGFTCADPTQDFAPSRILINRDYGNPKFKNDISLIKLDRPATITKWVRPICLPRGQLLTKNYIGAMAEVAGWGISETKTFTSSQVLLTVKLPVVPNRRCRRVFRRKASISSDQMCVGGRIGYDSCGGDSGGPLMKVDAITSPRYYAIGIVSFGSKYCGEKPTPAVYTRLPTYMTWILDNITPC